jgi:hypothetical protein
MFRSLLTIFSLLLLAGSSHAMSATYDGASLRGAEGSLVITGDFDSGGTQTFQVVWEIDLDGFDVTGAEATGHEYLTDIGFKAFSSVESASLDAIVWNTSTSGTFFESGNVSNAGCEGPSSAGFICVADLAPSVDATMGGVFRATFTVTGTIKLDEWTFQGKFGPENGWLISETAAPVPEPSAALVFGLGIVLAESLRRRKD